MSDWDQQWLITIASSENVEWPWSDAADVRSASQAFEKRFPGLHRHFRPFMRGLQARQDKGRFPWELRSCAYYADFAKPKLLYQDIMWTPQFAAERTGALINNTAYMLTTDDQWATVVLNAPIVWWFAWRAAQHAKDEALRYFVPFVQSIPIPPQGRKGETAAPLVNALCAIHTEAHAARRALLGWYRTEWGMEPIPNALKEPFTLDAAGFAAALRDALPRSRRLTAAAVSAIKAEHAATVAPVAARLAEAVRHERALSNLVLDAYGLTPEERAQMWRTAPPRMPILPPTDTARG